MIDPCPMADPAPHDDLALGAPPTPSASVTSQPRSEPNDETLDRSVIAAFRDPRATGPDFAVILIDQFLEEASSHMEILKDAVGRLDAPALKTAAHTLKGTSMTIGARHLAELSGQMERGAARTPLNRTRGSTA